MNLIETGQGYIELRADGTYKRHPYRFVQTSHDVIRYTFDDSGKVIDKQFYEPQDLVTIGADTGEILQIQTGLIADHELVPPVHPDPVRRYVQIRASEYPADFRDATTGVVRYRWRGTGLEPRPVNDINNEIAKAKASPPPHAR